MDATAAVLSFGTPFLSLLLFLHPLKQNRKAAAAIKQTTRTNVEVFLEKPAKMLPHPDPAAAEQPGLRRSLFVAVIVCDSSVLSFGKTDPLIFD